MAKEPAALRRPARGGSRGQGQSFRRAAKELAEEIQGRTPLLPASPPHRHQHGLRPRTDPRSVPNPYFPQDDAEADRQLRTPGGSVHTGHTQKCQQLIAVIPQVLGQPLVRRVALEREDDFGQRVVQPASRHRQAMSTDLANPSITTGRVPS